MSETPKRIQRKRTKGWKMPEGAVSVTRPGPYGNPFRVGGYFMMGDPDPRKSKTPMAMSWCEALTPESRSDPRFTEIRTNREAVDWFRLYLKRYPLSSEKLAVLRGKDLACWCPIWQPCHAQVLLEIANEGEQS